MMADSDQPMIWQLDSFPLEQRFATSFCKSRSEWERRQREAEEMEEEWRLAPPTAPSDSSGFANDKKIWSNSFTNMGSLTDMPAWESVNVILFAIGGHMAELVQDLRRDQDADVLVRPLHVRFDDLRVCVREQRELFVVRSSIADFVDALQAVWQAHDELGRKCADLETKLDFLHQRYAKHLGQDLEATY